MIISLRRQWVWPRRKDGLLLWLLFLAVMAGGLVAGMPYVTHLYHQARGGQLLAAVAEAHRIDQRIPCTTDPITDPASRQALEAAKASLRRVGPRKVFDAQALLLLGRVSCALGEVENAVEAYRQYTALRPNNPLGWVELAAALEALEDAAQRPAIIAAWKAAGVNTDEFAVRASRAFARRDYAQAAEWYHHAWFAAEELSPDVEFRWAMARVLTHHAIPPQISAEAVPRYSLQDGHVIVGGSVLQWVRDHPSGEPNFGDFLGKYPVTPPNIGVMWWGGPAVIFVEIEQAGAYEFSIKAQHTAPAPIRLQLEVNFEPVAVIELGRGDLSWETFTTEVTLDQGVHVIGVNYLNNGIVNGADRDACIEWVEIERK